MLLGIYSRPPGPKRKGKEAGKREQEGTLGEELKMDRSKERHYIDESRNFCLAMTSNIMNLLSKVMSAASKMKISQSPR